MGWPNRQREAYVAKQKLLRFTKVVLCSHSEFPQRSGANCEHRFVGRDRAADYGRALRHLLADSVPNW